MSNPKTEASWFCHLEFGIGHSIVIGALGFVISVELFGYFL